MAGEIATLSAATNITYTGATLNGDVAVGTGGYAYDITFEWATLEYWNTNSTYSNSKMTDPNWIAADGPITVDIDGLTGYTQYVYRFWFHYWTDAQYTLYSSQSGFTTLMDDTSGSTMITANTARLNGIKVTDTLVFGLSFQYSTLDYYITNGTVDEFTVNANPTFLTAPGTFYADISSLLPATTYKFRATGAGPGEFNGQIMEFSTDSSASIYVGSINSFGVVTINTTSTEQSYVVSGTTLSDDIIITPPSGFEVSLTSGSGFTSGSTTITQSGGTLLPTTIYVVFKPTSIQSYSGNITHTSLGATTKNVAVSGDGVEGAPSVQSSDINILTLDPFFMIIIWSEGNGDGRIVKINDKNEFTDPVDGVTYTVNQNWNNTGEQVVYDTTSNAASVSYLIPSTTYYFRVYEYNGSGSSIKYNTSLDTNNPNNWTTPDSSIIVQTGTVNDFGNISVDSTSSSQNYGVTGFFVVGSIDIEIERGLGNSIVYHNDRLYCIGDFNYYNENSVNNLIRLNTNGSVDNQFNIGDGFNDIVNNIKIQTDNKIIVCGDFTEYSGLSYKKLLRLNSGGTIDSTFDIGTGFNSGVTDIGIQSNDKIIAIGKFLTYNGNNVNGIIRLNSNGSIDNTFITGNGFTGIPYCLKIQSDDKILIGGDFTKYSGTTAYRIIRLNSDGSIDNTFDIGLGFSKRVTSIDIQSDNKILIGGYFWTYSGNTANYVIRLNSDGTKDNTFTSQFSSPTLITNFATFDYIHVIKYQSDGKILVGGDFTKYNNQTHNRLIRLNSDGTLDSSFDIGDGFNNVVNSIEIYTNNFGNHDYYIGGKFTSFNGNDANGIIKLNDNGSSISY